MTTRTEAASLSKLAIDRAVPLRRSRPWWRRWWVWLAVVLVVAGAAIGALQRSRPLAVEIGTVVAAYP